MVDDGRPVRERCWCSHALWHHMHMRAPAPRASAGAAHSSLPRAAVHRAKGQARRAASQAMTFSAGTGVTSHNTAQALGCGGRSRGGQSLRRHPCAPPPLRAVERSHHTIAPPRAPAVRGRRRAQHTAAHDACCAVGAPFTHPFHPLAASALRQQAPMNRTAMPARACLCAPSQTPVPATRVRMHPGSAMPAHARRRGSTCATGGACKPRKVPFRSLRRLKRTRRRSTHLRRTLTVLVAQQPAVA